MKKLFLIPLMLLATFMLTAACSEDEPLTDGQEQTTPEEDDGGNEGNNEEGGNVEEMWREATADTLSSIAPVQAIPSVWHRPSSPHWIAI